MILVDDGSTDKSTAIAHEFAQLYPGRIVYKDHQGHSNKGLAASRNLAIQCSSGDLITFLDGDDAWNPPFLAEIIPVLHQQNVSMVCEATEYWHGWTDSGKNDELLPVGTGQNRVYAPPQLLLDLYPLNTGAAPCVCGIVVKKQDLIKHGGFEETFRGMYEDQSFLIKFYLNERVYISSNCNNRYRQRQGSLVHVSHESGKCFHERKRFLEWLEN